MGNTNTNTTITLSITSSVGTESDCSDSPGALDYDVEIVDADGHTVEGGVTLWPDAVNGGMSTGGSPLEGWCSDPIVKLAYALDDESRRELLAAVRSACTGQEPVEIEIDLATDDAEEAAENDVQEIANREDGIESLREGLRKPACVEWGESACYAAKASGVHPMIWDTWRAAYEIAAGSAAAEAVKDYDSENNNTTEVA